jgi:hypothetical protein
VRRSLSIAILALAFLSITPSVAHAESSANTPKLALHKVELWLAASEPKPSFADLDAGMNAAAAAEERMAMLNTEMGAVASRRRTLQLQASALRQKAAALRAERDAPKGETGIKRSSASYDARIGELEKRAEALLAQAEDLYRIMERLSIEEKGIVDAVGRMRGITEMIETSSLATAGQKTKAVTLAKRTNKTIELHAAMIMTLVSATTASE